VQFAEVTALPFGIVQVFEAAAIAGPIATE
jgi:hypothetical protein